MKTVERNAVPIWCVAGMAGESARTIAFVGDTAQVQWSLADLDSSFPTDWSDYAYLVMEVKPSTPQRFYLQILTADGPRMLRLQPFGQGAWLRLTLPLQFFVARDTFGHDMASAGNRPRRSFWFGTSGPFGPLQAVEGLVFRMEHPVGAPTLEVRLLGLAKEDPESDILAPQPVIDPKSAGSGNTRF